MRVVCDNCGAVYKIADSKLTKEVNKATCKRCGHKIVIYKPGSRSQPEPQPPPADSIDEATVIRSVPELEKYSSQPGGGALPAIGSLTAELRAVSSPGLPPVGAPSSSTTQLPPLGPNSAPAMPAQPPPRPAPQIPAPPPPPPVSQHAPPPPPPSQPAPAARAGGPAAGGPLVERAEQSVSSQHVAEPTESTQAMIQKLQGGDPEAELGRLSMFGVVGMLGGMVAGITGFLGLAPQLSCLGITLAVFGSGVCALLPLLSQRGRRAGRLPAAIGISAVLAAVVLGLCMLSLRPAAEEVAAPQSSRVSPTEIDHNSTGGDNVGANDINALLSGVPTPTPAPTPVAAAVPVARPAATPEPTPKPTPKPAPAADPLKRRPRTRVSPRAAAPTPTPAPSKSSGPSPFVIDTIIRNNAAILRCFNVEKNRGTDVEGKIYMKFSISPDGSVERARITTSRFTGTALDTCVSREVNSLKFPEFDGSKQTVTYPFIIN